MKARTDRVQVGRLNPNASYSFRIIGAQRLGFNDAYHAFLQMPGWQAALGLVFFYAGVNALFALGYLYTGGIEHARPGSYEDAFFFSVQTMTTVGFGRLEPLSRAANWLVVLESLVGMVMTSVLTGLVFVRFSRLRPRIFFAKQAVIGPFDGVPTLAVRVGNERNNVIYDAQLRMMLSRTRRTAEGKVFYEVKDLKLARDHAPSLARAWGMLHRIDENSPLYEETPESLRASDAELSVAVTGVDSVSTQAVHGRFMYEARDIVFGARLADIIHELPNGDVEVDLRKFHHTEPTEPIDGFPYPAGPSSPP